MVILMFAACNNYPPENAGHDNHMQLQEKKVYTCPMHPQIIKDQPGQCPICGMTLVENKNDGKSIRDSDLTFLLKPTNKYVLSTIKTIRPQEKELPVEFMATGNIAYDTRLINTVSARVSGRIEKLYVKYKFQPVSKGDKLMDIYSKDLVTEQENYIFLLNNDNGNKAIITAAENKLMLMGLNKEQAAELKTSKKVVQTISIYSSYSGHLHDLSNMKQGNGMNNSKEINQELQIHEGMYVEKGQTVFNIYRTNKVWAILNFYPEGENFIKAGQKIKLSIDGINNFLQAKIDFIEPVLRPNQKTISARVYLDNPDGNIKIGALVKATVVGETIKGLYLPASSTLSLGETDVIFVLKDKLFKATPVKLGGRSDGWIEILSGLPRTEDIAENAQLLMDSESFVKTDKQ